MFNKNNFEKIIALKFVFLVVFFAEIFSLGFSLNVSEAQFMAKRQLRFAWRKINVNLYISGFFTGKI